MLKKILLIFTIVAVVFSLGTVTAGAAFNEYAAACTALSEQGVDADKLNALLDKIDGISVKNTETKKEFYASADAVFQLVSEIADMDDALNAAAEGWDSPPAVGNPFDALQYLSLLDRVDEDGLFDINLMSSIDVAPSMRQFTALCNEIASDKDAFDDARNNLYFCLNGDWTKNPNALWNLYEYFSNLLSKVDLPSLTILDLFFGNGFCTQHSRGLDSLSALLTSFDYDAFTTVAQYLPSRMPNAAIALAKFALSLPEFDAEALASTTAVILNNLYAERDIAAQADPKVIADALTTLASLPTDADLLTEAQLASATQATNSVLDLFSPLFPAETYN